MSQAPPEPRVYTFFVVKRPGEADRVVVWDTRDVSVGRAPDNDLCIDHSELSRRHAVFERIDRACVVRNLSASNGTFVSGRMIETHRLAAGDVIQMADLEFHFHADTRNPVTLGTKLVYSSQLKGFPSEAEISNPDATMLGLMDAIPEPENDDLESRSAVDYAYAIHGMSELGKGPTPRDLDAELEAMEMPVPERAAASADEPAEQTASVPLALRIEIDGLEPDARRQLESLRGRTLSLQGLRIRISE